jgi:hypothetical protein
MLVLFNAKYLDNTEMKAERKTLYLILKIEICNYAIMSDLTVVVSLPVTT